LGRGEIVRDETRGSKAFDQLLEGGDGSCLLDVENRYSMPTCYEDGESAKIF
jgi:hypothetical protein